MINISVACHTLDKKIEWIGTMPPHGVLMESKVLMELNREIPVQLDFLNREITVQYKKHFMM